MPNKINLDNPAYLGFKVGYRVVLAVQEGHHAKYGWGGQKNGDVGVVSALSLDAAGIPFIYVKFDNTAYNWMSAPHELKMEGEDWVADVVTNTNAKYGSEKTGKDLCWD